MAIRNERVILLATQYAHLEANGAPQLTSRSSATRDSDLYIGADIELRFSPSSTIRDTKRIWLVQFVRAIIPPTDIRLTKRG